MVLFQTAPFTRNGKITRVEFSVRDSSKHEYFSGEYEKYYAGNDLYMQQCRNDWKGIRSYPDSLLKYQDINKVDAISGATWSYNIFRATAQEAMKKAKKKVKINKRNKKFPRNHLCLANFYLTNPLTI